MYNRYVHDFGNGGGTESKNVCIMPVSFNFTELWLREGVWFLTQIMAFRRQVFPSTLIASMISVSWPPLQLQPLTMSACGPN